MPKKRAHGASRFSCFSCRIPPHVYPPHRFLPYRQTLFLTRNTIEAETPPFLRYSGLEEGSIRTGVSYNSGGEVALPTSSPLPRRLSHRPEENGGTSLNSKPEIEQDRKVGIDFNTFCRIAKNLRLDWSLGQRARNRSKADLQVKDPSNDMFEKTRKKKKNQSSNNCWKKKTRKNWWIKVQTDVRKKSLGEVCFRVLTRM